MEVLENRQMDPRARHSQIRFIVIQERNIKCLLARITICINARCSNRETKNPHTERQWRARPPPAISTTDWQKDAHAQKSPSGKQPGKEAVHFATARC